MKKNFFSNPKYQYSVDPMEKKEELNQIYLLNIQFVSA